MLRSSTTRAKSTSHLTERLAVHKDRRYVIIEITYPDPRQESGESVALFRNPGTARAFAGRHPGARWGTRMVDDAGLSVLRRERKLER